ncbi:MAG: hypothetical protein KC454_04370 [Flavobacteriales bacterium]|nr:hypothetical protein [Flavobacteriales bacterium]
MKAIKHHFFSVILIALIISYYWHEALTVESESSKLILTGISLSLIISAQIFKETLKTKLEWFTPFLHIIITSAAFVLTFYLWNEIFLNYSQNSQYSGNIFRGAFNRFKAPFYGDTSAGDIWGHKPIIVGSTIFLFFMFIWRKKWHKLKHTSLLFGLIGLLILSFGWHQSFEQTFLSANCHYKTFASDLSKFNNIQDILSQYTKKMGSLSTHNNHYPPGNMMLLKIEETYLPHLSKSLTFLATLFTLFPLCKLIKLWGFSKSEQLITFVFYGSSGAILFYPGIAMTPLMLPFSITAIYLMHKAFQKRSFIYPVAFAIVMAGYAFFTFTAFVFLLFCIIIIGFKVILKDISLRQVAEFGLISLITFISIYVFTFIVLDFNMLECFISSVANEKLQMDYSGIQNWSRYFIVSTGNILAYSGIICIPALGIIFHGFRNRNNSIPKHLKSLFYALVTTIILISFSNQFFLEVERIWISFTPFFIIISSWFIAQFYKEEKYHLVFSLILISVITSASLSIAIDHC